MLWGFFSPKSHPQKVLPIPVDSFDYICPDFQVSVSENRTVSVVLKQNGFGKLKPTSAHWIWVGQMQRAEKHALWSVFLIILGINVLSSPWVVDPH